MVRPKMVESSVGQMPSQLIDDPAWPGKTVVDDWQVLRSLDEIESDVNYQAVLLDIPITFNVTESREVRAWINTGCGGYASSSISARLKTCVQSCHLRPAKESLRFSGLFNFFNCFEVVNEMIKRRSDGYRLSFFLKM